MAQHGDNLLPRRAKTREDNTGIIPEMYYRITSSAYAILYL